MQLLVIRKSLNIHVSKHKFSVAYYNLVLHKRWNSEKTHIVFHFDLKIIYWCVIADLVMKRVCSYIDADHYGTINILQMTLCV